MKKFIITLLLLNALLCCRAADSKAEKFGNIAGAIKQSDRKLRLSLLLPQCARDKETFYRLRDLLKSELAALQNDKDTAGTLYMLSSENPAGSGFVCLAIDYCRKTGYTTSQIRQLQKVAAEAADLNTDRSHYLADALHLFRSLLSALIKEDQFEEAGKLLKLLKQAKSPYRKTLLEDVVFFYNSICFRSYDSTPQCRSWLNIPETSWKKEYVSALTELQLTEQSLNINESFARLHFYNLLSDPYVAEYAGRLLELPGCAAIFVPAARNIAFAAKDSVLYQKCTALVKSDIFTDFIFHAERPGSAEAVKAFKALPQHLQEQLELYLLFKAGEIKKGVEKSHALLDKETNPAKSRLTTLTIQTIINFIEKSKDKVLYNKLIKFAAPLLKDPSYANSFGYIGAQLDINLPGCEKLLLTALQKAPDSAAFLDSMAYIQFKLKKFEKASAFMMQALRQRTADIPCAVLFLHAAEIEHARSNRAKAREFLRRARFCAADNDEEFDYETAKRLEEALK